ncbi:hypothetical protein K458DRAFT_390754 [Lentithecium fluviatile CBS 122367]|uniref:Uncharacterized protein n=1 Tax=Lentithecium fluviatile CBS 122367 TaxID=1168545 RepID=A0A6G1IY69_9PLEO|nr:hypothetical protein K458DRAFT_390754 [Lentithecium fluviatile CBS 122367]
MNDTGADAVDEDVGALAIQQGSTALAAAAQESRGLAGALGIATAELSSARPFAHGRALIKQLPAQSPLQEPIAPIAARVVVAHVDLPASSALFPPFQARVAQEQTDRQEQNTVSRPPVGPTITAVPQTKGVIDAGVSIEFQKQAVGFSLSSTSTFWNATREFPSGWAREQPIVARTLH